MIFNQENFKKEVLDYPGLVLVDFFATWCGPCQMMGPIILELIKEYEGKEVKIGKLDVDENNQIAAQYNIMGVPSLLLFKNGQVIDQKVGMTSKEDIRTIIDKNL